MKNKMKILVGSCYAGNVQRIKTNLESSAELRVVESWEEFSREKSQDNYDVQITDLNLVDCFPSVVLNNIHEVGEHFPTIILLEDIDTYDLYRGRAECTIDIFPIFAVEDERFILALESAIFKCDILKSLCK